MVLMRARLVGVWLYCLSAAICWVCGLHPLRVSLVCSADLAPHTGDAVCLRRYKFLKHCCRFSGWYGSAERLFARVIRDTPLGGA